MRRGERDGGHGHWLLWGFLGAIAGIYAVGWRNRSKERQSSVEAIDDPAVTATWQRATRLPQFNLLWKWVADMAVQGRTQARVLDVGSGAGQLSTLLAQRPEVAHAIGIDLSAPMVEQARSTAEAHGVDATFLQVDAAEMPFADGEFDVVVSTLSLHHWHDPLAVLREIHRVLAPGGNLVIVDLRRDASPFILGMATVFSRLLLPKPVRELGEPLASFHAAFTPRELVALAARTELLPAEVCSGPFWLVLKYRQSGKNNAEAECE
ncbi:MAG: class I SAM-dependent methyltransferase [Armatimonadota bacterium]